MSAKAAMVFGMMIVRLVQALENTLTEKTARVITKY